MKKLSLYTCGFILSFLFFSCKSSRLLYAGFESDTINQDPATNLPGDPNGDVIQFNNEISSQLNVQASSTAGEKALHLIDAPVVLSGPSNRWVSFKGISSNLLNTLWFTHTGTNHTPVQDVLMDVSDGAGHLMARLRISQNGDVGLAKHIADNYTDVIGTLEADQRHTIIFTVNPSTLKYNVTILPMGGSAITATNKPMITTNALEFANPAHPSISFAHSNSGNGNHHYIIESVLISRKQPS